MIYFPAGAGLFSLGSSQPLFQGLLLALPTGVKQPSVQLIAHLHLLQKLRISGAAPLVPHTNLWLTQKKKLPSFKLKTILFPLNLGFYNFVGKFFLYL